MTGHFIVPNRPQMLELGFDHTMWGGEYVEEPQIIATSGWWSIGMALDKQGRVWQTTDVSRIINGLEDIVSISAGNFHAMALDNQNRVWTWGDNEWGQLGYGGTNFESQPRLVTFE